ncbi:hypothetical protein GCM10009665_22480 [Kitasatospora nipponensis]|uniref:NUDIX domain-containing protein n=1 Tax=Kitasatospora nipponensis TaxID=258049 RepID=A0ABN1W2P6_9ACTN
MVGEVADSVAGVDMARGDLQAVREAEVDPGPGEAKLWATRASKRLGGRWDPPPAHGVTITDRRCRIAGHARDGRHSFPGGLREVPRKAQAS